MGGILRRITLILSAALLVLSSVGGAAAPAAEASAREIVADEARRLGIDPEEVFAHPITLDFVLPDGGAASMTLPFGEVLDRALGSAPMAGVAGTPELSAGDFVHIYINIAAGDALAYDVSASSVPATPAFSDPQRLFIEYGGPTYNVKARDYSIGFHTAGTVLGSSVDTHESGPFVPVAHSASIVDTSLDFVGHGLIGQGQFCIFGICFATGVMQADGVTKWSDATADLPRLP